MPDAATIEQCESTLVALRANLVAALGASTVDVLFDRAIAEVAHAYPALSTLRAHNGDFSFDALHERLATEPGTDVPAAFGALTGVLLLVTARMLGKTVARQLAGTSRAVDGQGGYWLGE